MKALVGKFNQEKALVGAFSVIVQPVVEPMERFTALVTILLWLIISCAEVAELRALPVGRGQIGRVKYLAVGRAKPGQGRGGGQVSCDWRTAAT